MGNLDRSTIAMVFFLGLIALFLILIIATIVVIVSKSKRDSDEYDEEDVDNIEVDNLDDEYASQQSDEEGNTDMDVESGYSDESYPDDDYEQAPDDEYQDSEDVKNEKYDLDDLSDSAFAADAFAPYPTDEPTNEIDTDTVKEKSREKNIENLLDEAVEPQSEEETVEKEEEDAVGPQSEVEATEKEEEDAEVESQSEVETTEQEDETEAQSEVEEAEAGLEDEVVDEENNDENNDENKDEKEASGLAETEAALNAGIDYDAIKASVAEAAEIADAVKGGMVAEQSTIGDMFGLNEQMSKFGNGRKKRERSTVASDDEFYWFNRDDVASRPSHRKEELYYHYFSLPEDCIEDLLVEMYDCAVVRTEEIRYIAYGIEPKAFSMKQIMAADFDANQGKKKEPSTQDLVRIYEKWCVYVDNLFDKVEIHADEYTIENIRKQLCAYGRSDVEVLLEGK